MAPDSARGDLYRKYADKLVINSSLNRQMVSFQANKERAFYRWIKYKEAFSSDLVTYLLRTMRRNEGSEFLVLDPFAGAGTTLTTAAQMGYEATGIEILPVGVAAVQARIRGHKANERLFAQHLERLRSLLLDNLGSQSYRFPHLKITRGAFPEETERAISAYMDFVGSIKDVDVKYLFWFACLSILEEISYTRKDGQYLRWDARSGRALKSRFNKGAIHEFRSSIKRKLEMMLTDIRRRNSHSLEARIELVKGSCLQELPNMPSDSCDAVITSPPYANRYDYTRTYALEIAFMGFDEGGIKDLRQALLSCTVENKSKRDQLAHQYATSGRQQFYQKAVQAFENQKAAHEVLEILQEARNEGLLNNSNIPTLLENYLFEMNLVVWELARVLKPGGTVFMVNDNVRYHGEEVPVDLILSDLAVTAGLHVERIWLLPRGKGNSSQQMGKHGRTEIRKCIYCWSKPA
ncbi:MAG: DNA methyltransferase [Thermodesulfobacteriota bacterium]